MDADWGARVGSRVVVRHRLPEGGLTDAVGELLEAGPEALVVLTPRGHVRVDPADVVLSRVVPPRPLRAARPHRAIGIADLSRVMAAHWRAAEVEPFGSWLLRATEGFTDRADSVLALGEPPVPFEQALDHVTRWYAARNLPPRAALPRPESAPDAVPDELVAISATHAAFGAAGWGARPGAGALVMTADPRRLPSGDRALPDGLHLDHRSDADDAWLDGYHYLGRRVPEIGRRVLHDVPERLFVSVRDGHGHCLAVARGSFAHGWAAISAVETRPAARRRGLARALVGELGAWARRQRAAAVLLQAGIDNSAAQQMYLALGFEPHHAYDYLAPEVSA